MNDTFEIEVDGKLKEYKIVKILAPSNSDKRYLIYTEYGDDENKYYASRFEKENDDIILKDIDTEEEWYYIDKRMEEIKNG